jgi:hypothetical protein
MQTNKINQQQVDPPVKKKEVARYFVDLYRKAGKDISDEQAISFADSDIKWEIDYAHELLRLPKPSEQELDSIVSSFYDVAEVEKKNQVDTFNETLDSVSTQVQDPSSLESESPGYQTNPEASHLNKNKIFNDALARVDMNLFTSDPKDALPILQENFEPYGIKFEARDANMVLITLPDGTSRSYNFFTEDYKKSLSKLSSGEVVSDLSAVRLEDMKSFLEGTRTFVTDALMSELRNSNKDNVLDVVQSVISSYDRELDNEMIRLLEDFKDNTPFTAFYQKGTLNRPLFNSYLDKFQMQINEGLLPEKAKKDILSRSIGLSSVSTPEIALLESEKTKSARQSLGRARDVYARSQESVSATVGELIQETGAYANIDLDDEEVISKLETMGLNPMDLPIDAIKVNGQARSLNYLLSNVLYDFDKVQDIRDGKLAIEIGEPKTAGLLAPMVQKAKEVAEKQGAELSYFADSPFLRTAEEVFEGTEDFVQGIGFSLYGAGVHAAYLMYDSLRYAGIDQETADSIVYGTTGFWGVAGGGYRPEYFENVKSEYLPVWDGDFFSDLQSGKWHSFTNRSAQTLAESSVSTGLFFIPGAQTLAYTNIGIGAYSRDRIRFESLRKDILEKKGKNYILTEEELNILNTSDAKARSIAIGKAASEVGFTRLFTGNVFKEYHKIGKVGSQLEQVYGSIGAFNRQYAKATRSSLIGQFSKVLGVNRRLVANEIPEEEMISLYDYVSDVVFGYRKYDSEEVRSLVINTGLASLTNSYAIGVGMNVSTNPRVRRKGAELIKSRISIQQEVDLVSKKLIIDSEIARIENDLKTEGKDVENNDFLNYLKDQRDQINNGILVIDAEKSSIVERMTAPERVEFLDMFRQITALELSRKNAVDMGQRRDAEKQIQEKKDEAKKILAKYPSSISFYFAERAVQGEYTNKAFNSLKKEYEDRGEEFGLDTNDPIVLERAADKYFEDQKKKESEKSDIYYEGFSMFGISPLPVIQGPMTSDETEVSKNIANIIGISKSLSIEPQEGLTLDEAITQPIAEDQFSLPQKSAFVTNGTLNKNGLRVYDIGKRLAELDMGVSFNNFTESEAKVINDFYKVLEKGYIPPLGKMEAMLDAHERVNTIYNRANGQIKLTGFETRETGLTEKGMKLLYETVNAMGARGIATLDILKNVLFRDENIGRPFLDTYQEVLRLRSESKQDAEKSIREALDMYIELGGKTIDDITIEDDYEIQILSMLKRESSAINPSGKNEEFERNQKLILDELELRRLATLKDPGNKNLEKEYEVWKDVVERLDVKNATSFEDFNPKAATRTDPMIKELDEGIVSAGNAKLHNYELVNRLASLMPSQEAFDRINDFESYKAFEYNEGTYMPMLMFDTSASDSYSEYFGPSATSSKQQAIAGSLMNVTRPESLQGGLRLNSNFFLRNVLNEYTGMKMDIATKKEREILRFMVNSEKFQSMFIDDVSGPLSYQRGIKKPILERFMEIPVSFDKEIRRGGAEYLTLENINKIKLLKGLDKVLNSVYGIASTNALARIFQPASQYFSAVGGGSMNISSRKAKTYLTKKTAQFTLGAASILDKSRRSRVADILKVKDKGLGNIYAMSRTGSRNALLSELALDPTKKIPVSYYVSAFNLDSESESSLLKISPRMEFDRFIEAIDASNELSLKLFLSNADKLASNAVFEAAYLDYFITKKGENITNIDAWFAQQNRNPNKEAIRHADDIIAKTMRQTDPISEAKVYKQDASRGVKYGIKSLYAFNKFIINARTDISKNLAIMADPNVSPEQAKMAERAIYGRALEIFSYDATKYGTAIAMTKGASEALATVLPLFLGGGVEERDVEEFGGMTELISGGMDSRGILPISGVREGFDPSKITLEEAETLTEFKAIENHIKGFTEIEGIVEELQSFQKTFDQKFKTQNDYSVFGRTIQDLAFSMSPLPTPSLAEGYIARSFNSVWGEDILEEYVSFDDEKLRTMDGRLDYLSENAGIPSLAIEQFNSYERALEMARDFKIEKAGGEAVPVTVEYLYAETDSMREALIKSTDLLLTLRTAGMFMPAGPRADIDKFADKLERAIDTYFTRTSNPDDRLMDMRESNSLFPFEQKLPIEIPQPKE